MEIIMKKKSENQSKKENKVTYQSIKENPEIETEGSYVKLNVEKYGGMLCAPWFDRPLSVAGRLVIKEENRLVTKLVSVDKDLLLIPSLAIHMNREANDGYKYNLYYALFRRDKKRNKKLFYII